MKTFILITLFAFNAFAGEFVTEQTLESKFTTYKAPGHITIDIISVNAHERTANVSLNGELFTRPFFLVSIANENDYSKYTYKVEFPQSSYHAGSCDESETIKSYLSFDVILENSSESFRNLEYSMTYKYSIDNCHDFSPEMMTIKYKEVQTL